MLSWAIMWDVIKVVAFPIIGIIFAIVQQKFAKFAADIEKLESQNSLLDKKMIRMEATFVTHDQMRELFTDLLTNMEKSNEVLEKRLEKTMDLKIDPLKDMLSKLVNKR